MGREEGGGGPRWSPCRQTTTGAPPSPLPPPPLLRRQRSGSAGCRLGSAGWLAQYQGRLLTAGGLARRLARGGWGRGVFFLEGGKGASETTIKHCWTPPPAPSPSNNGRRFSGATNPNPSPIPIPHLNGISNLPFKCGIGIGLGLEAGLCPFF